MVVWCYVLNFVYGMKMLFVVLLLKLGEGVCDFDGVLCCIVV